MKNVFVTICFVIAFSLKAECVENTGVELNSETTTSFKAPIVVNGKGATVKLSIDGMKCGKCQSKVRRAIRANFPSAKKILVSIPKASASFQCVQDSCELSKLFADIAKHKFRPRLASN